jgi:hypothetical protein
MNRLRGSGRTAATSGRRFGKENDEEDPTQRVRLQLNVENPSLFIHAVAVKRDPPHKFVPVVDVED